MIPDPDGEPRAPLTLEFAFVLALLAPLIHLLWVILLGQIGVRLPFSAIGMAALITYGGLFALCAARFRQPPQRQLALVPAPLSAWLAVLFLAPSVVVASEIDNVLKALVPPPPLPMELVEAPRYFGTALALLYLGVYPLVYGFFFRGVFQPLAASRLGVIAGVTLTSILSGFAMGFLPAMTGAGLWVMAPALINALTLSILRQSAKSLWPSLALHSLWGVVYICAEYRMFGLAGFDADGAHTPTTWVAGAALLMGVGLALCRSASRSGGEGSRAAPG